MDYRLERFLIGARGQRLHGEAVVAVEEDFLRVAEPFTPELEFAVTAALHPAGQDQREARRRGERGRNEARENREHHRNASEGLPVPWEPGSAASGAMDGEA